MSLHFAPIPPETPRDRKRLDSKISLVDGGYSSPCHSVAGFRRHKQYPGFQIGPRAYRAHRVTYAWAFGDTPYDIHHKCDNAWCVNPEHLEPAVDGQKRHRNTNADLCSKGHPFDGVSGRGDRTCSICLKARSAKWMSVPENRDAYNARRREKREHAVHEPRACKVCGTMFTPKRLGSGRGLLCPEPDRADAEAYAAWRKCVNERQRRNRNDRLGRSEDE